jgi:hypothetical protein
MLKLFSGFLLVSVLFLSLGENAVAKPPKKISKSCRNFIVEAYEAYLVTVTPLPTLPRISVTPGTSLEILGSVGQAWTREFDTDQLEAIVTSVKDQGAEALTKENRKSLKKIRRAGTLLRSAYLLLGSTHETPKPFGNFIRELGTFNDLATFGRQARDTRKSAARLLTEHALNDLRTEVAIPDVGDQTTVHQYFRDAFDADFKRLADPLITIENYHEIRKHLREARNLYRLMSYLPTPVTAEEAAAESYLTDFNKVLGQINDRLLQDFLEWYDDERAPGDLFEARARFERRVKLEIPSTLKVRLRVIMAAFLKSVAPPKL